MDKGPEDVGWRPAFSILTGVGWVSFVIIWLFFFAGAYNIYQNIAILIVSILVLVALNGFVWAVWGLKSAPGGLWKTAGWRGIVSMITILGWLVFLIVWLFRYAASFNVYQNIAIFIVSLIIVGGVNAAMWSAWREKTW